MSSYFDHLFSQLIIYANLQLLK